MPVSVAVCVCVFQSQLCPTLVLQQTMCTYIPITCSHGGDDNGGVCHTHNPIVVCVCVCVFQSQLCPTLVLQQTMCTHYLLTWR